MCLRAAMQILVLVPLLGLLHSFSDAAKTDKSKQRQILVFGGNGFLGASTVERLVRQGDNVTIVNRGNWYWDSKDRIKPHVNFISCDRKNNISSCDELMQLIRDFGPGRFDAVIDFSSYGPSETKDSTTLLKNKASIYIHISTDSIYDVCDIQEREVPLKEEQAERPKDTDRRDLLNSHHDYGNRKLQAEEELIKQRNDPEGGIPYVILRLPDVIGPRDTTYRFWIYQLWIRLASQLPKQPVVIPKFLVDYKISFVYVEDVAKAIVGVIEPSKRNAVLDQVFNLAWPETVTLPKLLHDIESALGLEKQEFRVDDESSNVYFYPTSRTGPLDSNKAVQDFGWQTTPWEQAIAETVRFYDEALTEGKFDTQRDEIIQIQAMQFYSDDKLHFYDTLEKEYNINISHFKPRDEL